MHSEENYLGGRYSGKRYNDRRAENKRESEYQTRQETPQDSTPKPEPKKVVVVESKSERKTADCSPEDSIEEKGEGSPENLSAVMVATRKVTPDATTRTRRSSDISLWTATTCSSSTQSVARKKESRAMEAPLCSTQVRPCTSSAKSTLSGSGARQLHPRRLWCAWERSKPA